MLAWFLASALASPPQSLLQVTILETDDRALQHAVKSAVPAMLPLLARVLPLDPRVNVISAPSMLAAYGETAEVEVGRDDVSLLQIESTATRADGHTRLDLGLQVRTDREVTWSGQLDLEDGVSTCLVEGGLVVIVTPVHIESSAQLEVQQSLEVERRLLVQRLFAGERRRERVRRVDALLRPSS